MDARLSEREFAQRVSGAGGDGWSVSNTTVANYEKGGEQGTAKVPHDYIAAVCREFDISVTWLVTGDGLRYAVPTEIQEYRLRVAGRVIDGTLDATLPELLDDATVPDADLPPAALGPDLGTDGASGEARS